MNIERKFAARIIRVICVVAVIVIPALAIPALLHAQYSSDVMALKQLSELYDERGFMQNKSITVDGKLIVSNSNGNISYSYPISSTTVSGYPFEVTLNYCGSVAFSSFLDFDAGTPTNPYTHWRRFHQNRPAWVLGVNNFAVGVISSSANFHCHPNLAAATKTQFNDDDFTWVVDGFDFNNRMARIETADGSNKYVDEIRLLRADGSLLHLVNVKEELPNTPAYHRSDLYTGYYYVNEANSRGYGIVEFDSTYWPGYIRNEITAWPTFQHIPRRLRYYDGSGLEYIFYEWIIPYGKQPYLGQGFTQTNRFGSTVGGPSIFYLERINSNAGEISRFYRSRHYYPNERTTLIDNNIYRPQLDSTLDSTRGRALITEFHGHRISYGDVGLLIESFGRTIKAQFGTITHSGVGAGGNSIPLATRGYMTTTTAALANAAETSDAIYRSHTGYITELSDAEGRKTTFEYEPYRVNYVNYGFPKTSPAPGVDIQLALKNHRLKKVVEPAAIYTISYRRGNFNIGGLLEDVILNDTIRADVASGHDPYRLNNVASYIRKYDRANTLLSTQQCEFTYSGGGFTSGTITTTDNITGLSRSIYNSYSVHPLPESHNPVVPQPRFTSLDNTVETGAVSISTSTSYIDSTNGGYLWLPREQAVTVDGLLQSKQRFSYLLDTVRTFGGDSVLRRKFGWEVMRKAVETIDPGTGKVRLRDTVEYLHVPAIDTALMRLDSIPLKLITLQRYRDSLAQPGSRFRNIPWEYASYDPAIAEYQIDSSEFRQTLPPIYGLERRSWRSDSAGRFLGGSSRAYREAPAGAHYFHDMAFRGTLLADTVFGLDRAASFVAARYDYTRGWGLNLLSRKFNALGASERYFYTSYASLKLRGSDGVYRPLGKIVSNDNEVRDTILPHNGYFSLAFEKPLVSESYVRRYDPATGTLLTDTLLHLNEYTHYGQVKGSVDMNGYYSRYAYDRNGRLKTAWLPLDFPSLYGSDTVQYTGTETMDLYGRTYRSSAVDTLKCTDTTWKFKFGVPDTTWIEDLYTGHPIHTSDVDCPCGSNNGVEGLRTKKHDRSLQINCFTWLYKPGADYYVGHLPIHLDSTAPLARALSLDSAWLMLHTSSIEGSCITLTVEIPQYGFTKNFLFNCPEPPPDDNSRAKGKGDRSLQSGESGTGWGSTGRSFRVNLDSIKSQLTGLASGKIDVYLRVANPNGGIRFINGDNAEDTRPKLVLKGTFQRVSDMADYTLAYQYDDAGLSSTITAKVDDSSHTANRFGPAQTGGMFARRTQAKHFFGADYRLLRSERQIHEPAGTTRTDTVRGLYDGLGQVRTAVDQEGNRVHTSHDASGRVIENINTDSTSVRTSYHTGTPASFGISGQDFHGFCAMTTITNENGIVFAKYSDAFGQTRREIADTAGLRLTTLYEYDIQGRLVLAISPKGDSTRYTYDTFGRVKTKSQPDIGTVSYAYDVLGNVRFTQTQKQAEEERVTFSQYDDLNRLVYTGEANLVSVYDEEFDDICASCHGARAERDDQEHPTHAPGLREEETEKGGGGDDAAQQLEDVKKNMREKRSRPQKKNEEKKGSNRSLQSGGMRLTETLNPNVLNDDGISQILTANRTLWLSPDRPVPAVPYDFWFRDCQLPPDSLLGETTPQFGRKIVLPAEFYPSTSLQPATEEDFEHIGRYPEFGRMAVAYDALPELEGSVWENFPHHEQWDDLAPTGKVRNLKGREAAVAYRERGSEPYNYTVLSYDERGRVEALLRFTENLGFDAVYYGYNSMNQVTRITTVDAVRQFSTYYGFDKNGRVDSVWTELGTTTSGFYSIAGLQYPGILERPDSAAILYRYNKLGMVDSMAYPAIRTGVSYTYNKRKWLDQMIAKHPVPGLGMQPVFLQKLYYDSTGQIEAQEWCHGAGALQRQDYSYDPVQRLTEWQQGGDTTQYRYDNVGNRMRAITGNRSHFDEYFLEPGKNRLQERVQSDTVGQWGLTTLYSHNSNGSMIERQRWETEDGLNYYNRGIDQYGYSHRELMRRYVKFVQTTGPTYPEEDWRYRYNAGGERDQKRLYYKYSNWSVPEEEQEFPWQYYLLGGSKEQLAVYHGRQMQKEFCGDSGMRVMMYPVEYLTNTIGGTAPIVTLPDGTRNYRIADHLGSVRSVLNHSGSVISMKDFMPFGKEQAVTGGDVRQGYIGKELDRESEVAVHGVRVYSADEGRFISGDVLWEKYRGWSPYQYSLNSPVQLTDHNGMFVDFGAIRAHHSPATARRYEGFILRGLEEVTGLTLRIRDSDCGLEVDWSKGINGGSATAREALLQLINAAEEINITVNAGDGTATILGTSISYSYKQMASSERGAVGVHPKTSSWGMIFFHEIKHLNICGVHLDPPKVDGEKPLGVIGEPDRFANKIRAELGPEWGQRLSYWEYRFKDDPGYGYLPFTPDALNTLNQGKKPESGYIRMWVGFKGE